MAWLSQAFEEESWNEFHGEFFQIDKIVLNFWWFKSKFASKLIF